MYNIVESIIVAILVGLMIWLCNVVFEHSKMMARQDESQKNINERVNRIELGGSSSLSAHVQSDDSRVEDIKSRIAKLENAVISLQSTPGELKALGVALESNHETLKRIEERLDRITK